MATKFFTDIHLTANKVGRDADNLIDFSTDDNVVFRVNGANEIELAANVFRPSTHDGIGLGLTSYRWSDLYLASGAIIDFGAASTPDVTLTHSSNLLALTGGNFSVDGSIAAGTTLATGSFTLPNSIGSSGQVLQVASSGTTLEWSSCCSGGGALDIDGLSDIGAALVDADIFAVDDGANGTNRKCTMARLSTYINGKVPDADGDNKGLLKVASIYSGAYVSIPGSPDATRQYQVQTDSNGLASVNVAWTDTNTTTTADVKTALGAAMGSNALQIGDGSTTTTFPGAITVTGNINANGNIVGDDGTNITNINSIESDVYAADADNTTNITMAATEISCLVEDTDVFTVTSSTFNFDAAVKTTINKRKFAKTSTTDGNANGDIVYFGGTTSMTTGAIYHYKSDGTWELADADSAVNCDGMLGVALGAASDTNGVLLRGMVTLDHDPGAVGDVLFLSTTAGDATATAPSGNGDIVRVIGYCLDASNGQIYFNPDGTYVEVSA